MQIIFFRKQEGNVNGKAGVRMSTLLTPFANNIITSAVTCNDICNISFEWLTYQIQMLFSGIIATKKCSDSGLNDFLTQIDLSIRAL